MKIKFHWYLSIAIFVGLVSTSFFNCSPTGFKSDQSTLDQIQVSTQCNQVQKISTSEMFELIEKAHTKLGPEDKIRCPGFFAVLDDPQSPNANPDQVNKPYIPGPSLQQKMLSAANDCNTDGPKQPPPTPPPSGKEKEDLIRSLLTKTNPANFMKWIRAMSDGSQWTTRYHASNDRRKVGEWVLNEMRKIAGSRTDISLRLVEHKNTPQPSVEAIIQGTGPNKSKFVVFGGHLDSINSSTSKSTPDSSAPGADDNASGISTVLEVFRVLVESNVKPDASIAFYGYAAEEIGLVGSQEIARTYADARKEVLGVMQVDMDSYTSDSASKEIMFITDFTSKELTETAAQLAKDFVGLNVTYDKCGYGCSDHASWNQLNYHAIMPAEKEVWTSVKRIHTTADIVDSKTQGAYADKFIKLGIAFLVTLGF